MTKLMHYVPDFEFCAYSTNPFCLHSDDVLMGAEEQEDQMDIQTDETA